MTETPLDLASPNDLARWTLRPLVAPGASRRTRWRQLEPWWQVELFASLSDEPDNGWKFPGDFELPYATGSMPRKKAGTAGIKWIDLALVREHTALLIELKDLGLNPKRVLENVGQGVAKDLVALNAIDWRGTLEELRNPSSDVKDAGRKAEFEAAAARLARCTTLLCATVYSQRCLPEPLVDVVDHVSKAARRCGTIIAPEGKGASTDAGITVRVLMLPARTVSAG